MIALYILPAYIVANLYVCIWLIRWIKDMCGGRLPIAIQVIIHILYWPLPLAMYVAILVPEGDLRRILNVAGTYWYGVLIYILLIIGVLDLIRVIIRKKKKIPKGEPVLSKHGFKIVGAVSHFLFLLPYGVVLRLAHFIRRNTRLMLIRLPATTWKVLMCVWYRIYIWGIPSELIIYRIWLI